VSIKLSHFGFLFKGRESINVLTICIMYPYVSFYSKAISMYSPILERSLQLDIHVYQWGVARKIFLLRQRLTTCIGRQVFGRERVKGTLCFRGFYGVRFCRYLVAFLQNLFVS